MPPMTSSPGRFLLDGAAVGCAQAPLFGAHEQVGLHTGPQHGNRALWLLGELEGAKGVPAVDVEDDVQVDLAYDLEVAEIEGDLREELAGASALDVSLAETRVGRLDRRELLGAALGIHGWDHGNEAQGSPGQGQRQRRPFHGRDRLVRTAFTGVNQDTKAARAAA